MVGGRDAAVIVHVELFKTVQISFNLYFPRRENGSWIQNGRFYLFCQWDVQKYPMPRSSGFPRLSRSCLCHGGAAPGTSQSCWLQVGKSPNSKHVHCVPGAASSGSSCVPVGELNLRGWGGNKKHSQVCHGHGLSSILAPKSVWTKMGLLPREHLEGLEESTSSTWSWGWYKSCFFKKQKHIPHRWVNCDRNRWVHGKVTEANSPGFIFKSSTWTVNILMLVCPYVIWDHDKVRGDSQRPCQRC